MSKEQRSAFVGFKVTEKEKQKIEADAEKNGMDSSNYIRWKLIYKDQEGGGGQ